MLRDALNECEYAIKLDKMWQEPIELLEKLKSMSSELHCQQGFTHSAIIKLKTVFLTSSHNIHIRLYINLY